MPEKQQHLKGRQRNKDPEESRQKGRKKAKRVVSSKVKGEKRKEVVKRINAAD